MSPFYQKIWRVDESPCSRDLHIKMGSRLSTTIRPDVRMSRNIFRHILGTVLIPEWAPNRKGGWRRAQVPSQGCDKRDHWPPRLNVDPIDRDVDPRSQPCQSNQRGQSVSLLIQGRNAGLFERDGHHYQVRCRTSSDVLFWPCKLLLENGPQQHLVSFSQVRRGKLFMRPRNIETKLTPKPFPFA